MGNQLQNFKFFVRHNSKPRVFLIIYCVLLIIGLALSFLGLFVSFLTICLPMFGHSACSSIGGYLLVLINLPGYIFAALILPDAKTIPEIYSLIIVGGVSLLFYYFLGKFVEGGGSKGISVKKWIIWITLCSTFLLLVLFVYLFLRVKM